MSSNKEEEENKKISVIDLLESDDDDDEIFKDTKPIFAAKNKTRKPSPDSVIGASTSFFPSNAAASAGNSAKTESEDRKPAAVEILRKLGSFTSNIVGAQSYPGIPRRGDTLTLAREATNAYDRHAVKFNNTSDGAKRGNLPREHAAVVAPIVDNMSNKIKFTATIQSVGDRYMVPVAVDVFAKSYHVLSLAEIQKITESVDQHLSKLDWTSGTVDACSASAAMKELAASTNQAMAALSTAVASGTAVPQSPSMPSIEDFIPAEVDLTDMNWESQQEELDALFEKIQEEQLANLPDIPMPKQFKHLTLYDYQQLGIRWLINQERTDDIPPFYTLKQSMHGGRDLWCCNITGIKHKQRPLPIRGSCLCDDMGLGKTLSTLGLILLNPPADQRGYPYTRKSLSSTRPAEPRCTLVVCPVSVIANWMIQVKKHVNNGDRKIVLKTTRYHGPNRASLVALIQYNQVDIMVTSYNTLAYDYRKYIAEMDPKNNKKRKAKSANQVTIFDVEFHRIVLDEAHIIRSSSTGFFKATNALRAKYKLCLTGTPFVNKPNDIHSLLAFLQVQPLCVKTAFDRAVTQRIKERDDRGLSTLRTTMAHVALRRTKAQVHSTIKLVDKIVETKKLVFKEGTHKRVHDMLFLSARAVFVGFLRRGGHDDIIDNYMAFLVLILRVRQACCSSGLVPKECVEQAENVLDLAKNAGPKGLDPDLADDLLKVLQGQLASVNLEECAVCRNELEEESAMILKTCKHIFCDACLSQIRNQCCPMCRIPYSSDDMVSKKQAAEAAKKNSSKNASKNANKANKLERPPKIQALLDAIEEEMKPDEKGVIFSQWTSYLDIIEVALAKEGYTYTRLDGTMSAADRIDAMEAFDTEGCDSMETPRFILCSLHAAGVGINLTRGNFCFMMDCWWNAAAENQACDRIHRIGQKRPVKIIRFLIDDSIETRMIALQESKSALGKGSLQKLNRDEKRKARMTTLHELFQVADANDIFDM